ncbi:glycosyltransferase family 4 protein [Flavobacterium sasangense]|uniref:glycosyltransferase family 4 protein n=1 Tax=Flavobacterium sasangense TaxID=503361 RepID=UPI00047C523E|nr:glycosyltransferase family 4 protein [Flavobacterium sasangense]
MKKTCLLYNFAQHYRAAIFCLLDKEGGVDFYFGDKMQDVKKLDYSLLSNFKYELKNIKIFSPIYWQKGAVSLFFKSYDKYIILGEYFCLSTWLILLLSKFSNKKVYLWTHGWYSNEGFLKKIIKKIFFNLSDGLLLYGNYAKNLMLKEGFSQERLHVIYNSLDYDTQLQIREKLKTTNIYSNYFKNDYPVLIFVGRLSKIKKLDQIVNAFQLLKEKDIFVNLVFVGKGSEEEDLKAKLETIGNRNYWFYGACYDEEIIGELIYNATICVSPGNVGLTAMHALVYGTPVITHSDFSQQMPEFEAVEKGVSGDFFIMDDEVDLANKIQDWLSKVEDREEIRTNCFKVIDEKYNPHYQLQVIKEILKG